MQVVIVTPGGEKFAGEAASVRAPGRAGELGLLPGHRDMIAALRVGICEITPPNHGEPVAILVDEGYVQVSGGERVIVVTEKAELKNDVDVEAARADFEQARGDLRGATDATHSETWQVRKHALDLAETRLRVAGAL